MIGWEAYWAAQQADIRARERALRERQEQAEAAWISPAQKKWALADIAADEDALAEDEDALARQQEEEEP